MKIRDLDLDQYVIVYDIGKSEHNEGMTVVGRVEEIVFNDDNDNVATINSLGNLYEITDNDEFELWSKSIEGKTESVSEKGITVDKKHFDNIDEEHFYHKARVEDMHNAIEKTRGYVNEYLSNDVQQRKRKDEDVALFKIRDLKVGYKIKILDDTMTGEVSKIANNGKSAEIRVDDGVYRDITDNNDFTILEWNAIPEYAAEDMVNSPSHYMLGNHEVKDIVSLVADKYHKGSVAHNIASALEYQMRAPEKNGLEDIKKARKCLDFAIENWDVK
ncbi:DUF3310 domain-containing protein [Staphylococcus saprophyticus]|uniref:DUF3310 domain-containing protein n=1 Tax=Staphylococcus saprophyticus TaxID=29385 RepID=UPI0019D70AF9|nr:DUF3310 domain-containing protein [Staphylococcus saprophyticus]